MKKITVCLILFTILVSCTDKAIYDNGAFRIYPDRVEQGRFVSKATSDSSLESTYASHFTIPVKNAVFFKLAINGIDNERDFAQNHQWMIPVGADTVTSPVFTFGQADPALSGDPVFLDRDVNVTFRVDMRPVLSSFKRRGYFETFNKTRIDSADFGGVYIAGNVSPLTWDFGSLISKPEFKLADPDGDSVFSVTLLIPHKATPVSANTDGKWSQTRDLSRFPAYQSDSPLLNALYRMSLEEMLLNIREDGAFMAGKEWTGVWTRDISYSIHLALAGISPESSKTSLLAKTADGRIIQDTGTGGSWPVSTDRLVWSLAAWEIYLSTGDRGWLETAYQLISQSVETDWKTAVEPSTGLLRGESSFLDWREQSYPRWMESKDIYDSYALGTVSVYAHTLDILSAMSEELGQSEPKWSEAAMKVKKSINDQFWLPDSGYFSQYVYGRVFKTPAPGSETLGNSLLVWFGLTDSARSASSIRRIPSYPFGTPTFHPQLADVSPYHNKSMWPFVQAYYTLAARQTGFLPGVEHGLASMVRAGALFLTNKENLVISTGDFMGTEINSDRQLWSVGGQLAMVNRVLLGIKPTGKGLAIRPVVPPGYTDRQTLSGYQYRNATIHLTVQGFGYGIESATVNGNPVDKVLIPANATGVQTIVITMNNKWNDKKSVRMMQEITIPPQPVVTMDDGGTGMSWKPVGEAKEYEIFRNGVSVHKTRETAFRFTGTGYAEYQVRAISAGGPSLLSRPVLVKPVILAIEAEGSGRGQTSVAGFSGNGYLFYQTGNNPAVTWKVTIPETGRWELRARYANGNGPVNTNNRCGIRTLRVNGNPVGVVVFPQRGDGDWTNWGESSGLILDLKAGQTTFTLTEDPWNRNMNGQINDFLLDRWEWVRVGQ